MKSKKNTKPRSKVVSAKMESAGHIIESNVWFKIGLSKIEANMLKAVGGEIFGRKTTRSTVGRALIQAALAHYQNLKHLMFKDVIYAENEGFFNIDHYMRRVIAREHARIIVVKKFNKG